jgi:polyribonucleotide nucleotidyltransferase
VADRLTINQINSDQLDALYERLEKAEQEADTSVAAAAHLTTLVGKRSERAEQSAEEQRRRADIFETELRVLREGLRANGADPTQIQNLWAQIRLRNRQWREEKQRAETAEAALARVAQLADEYPAGIDTALIHAALNQEQK